MERMVLLDDMVKDIRDARGVDMRDKNPLQRVSGAKTLENGSKVYDFGVEVSEPAVDTKTSFVANDSAIELTQSASSVVLVVDHDNLCELHFDTVAAKQIVDYTYEKDKLSDAAMEDMRRLGAFVDSIPSENIDPNDRSSSYWEGIGVGPVLDEVFEAAGMVRGTHDEHFGAGGVESWYLEDTGAVSTVAKFDAVASSRLLNRLGQEKTVGGARTLLAEFASGYVRNERDDFIATPGSLDMDSVVETIREGLKSQDYATCQDALEAFVKRDSERGHVSVEHHSYVVDLWDGFDDTMHLEPVEFVGTFVCKDLSEQLRVAEMVETQEGLPARGRSLKKDKGLIEYGILSDVTGPVAVPAASKKVSEIELFDVLDKPTEASVGEPEM